MIAGLLGGAIASILVCGVFAFVMNRRFNDYDRPEPMWHQMWHWRKRARMWRETSGGDSKAQAAEEPQDDAAAPDAPDRQTEG